MARRLLAVVVAVTVVVVVAAAPAVAHGWSLEVDPQGVGDDAVVLKHVSMLEPGIVAVHRLEDGELGPVLGAREFEEAGESDAVGVPLDRDGWAAVEGTARLAAVVHTSDDDGTFEWPGDDAVFRTDDPVITRFDVEKADGSSARVVGVRQPTSGNVTLRTVDLPDDGFVVLYEEVDGSRGDVVGVRPLAAGHHEDVQVAVDPRYYNDQRSRLYLVAAVLSDDGDGTFEPGEDAHVTVNGSTVASTFDAEKQRNALPTRSPTASPTATATDGGTATGTDGGTATGTDGGTATATDSPTTTPDTAAEDLTASPTDAATPGLGVVVALVALVALAGSVLRARP
jgi:hypothetical protein